MVWTNARKLTVIAVGTGAGLAAYYYQRLRELETTANASWTHQPVEHTLQSTASCGFWDNNWDFRDPKSLVRPMKSDSAQEQNDYNSALENARPTASRHIIMIRHGEYMDLGDTDDTHMLTDRGRLQAKFTGKRLRDLGIKYDKIIASTMVRAQETADIIIKELGYDANTLVHCNYIREGAPIPPQPPVGHWRPPNSQFFQDGARIEAGFRRYFHRAHLEQKTDSYTLIVGHANVIRYYVCRALQLPPEAWLRMNINHASITWLTISPSGNVSIKYLGDSGFLPPKYLTNKIPRNSNSKGIV